MKESMIFFFALLSSFSVLSQDMIVTTSGDNIPCKVVRVTKKNVKYKLPTIGDTTILSQPKQTVYVIRYEDGEKEFFNESKVDDNDEEGKWDKEAMTKEGKKDAALNYEHYRAAKATTAVVAAVCGPIVGLIPAIACSSTPPESNTLDYPDKALMKNDEYSQSYKDEARHIKSRKVWSGYLLGVAIDVAVIVLAIVL